MTNAEKIKAAGIRHSGSVIGSSFVIRLPRRSSAKAGHSSFSCRAFTLIELVVVLGLILILTGLVLSTVGYARKKSARARAETEIAAMAAALESYKADNASYPRSSTTDTFTAVTNRTPPDPQPTSYDPSVTAYSSASFYLYQKLSGNPSGDRTTFTQQTYFQFKPNMLSPPGGTGTVTAIRDPFGNSYGYSTAQAYYLDNPSANLNYGFNPTFDLWSTAGTSNATDAAYENAWTKNW
jgi:prepilin-type N-terminal cleavage/methylation domain-containing protein